MLYFSLSKQMTLTYIILGSGGSGKKSGQKGGGKGSNKSKRKAPDEVWTDGQPPERRNPLAPFLVDKLPTSTSLEDPSLEVLCLLRALHALNR
jgi:E3 ubiquitin-protein ligase TRIP12